MSPCRNLLSSFAILATALFFVAPVGIVAQSSEATCLPAFGWMDNSKNQSPCLVAAYLMSVCDSTAFVVEPLSPTEYYRGTLASGQRACACSTVTYSAFSACAICQNAMETTWSLWSFNCSSTYLGSYAPAIPSGTAVPQWMFQDVTITDMFNATHAEFIGDSPESTATQAQSSVPNTPAGTSITTEPVGTGTGTSALLTSQPTGTGAGNSASLTASADPIGTSTQISTQTSTQTSTSAPSGGGSKTGAIVGGVIGGVVGLLAIVGLAAFFLVKKPSQPQAEMAEHIPSAVYTDGTSFGLPNIDKS